MHLCDFLFFQWLDPDRVTLKQRLIKLVGRFASLSVEPLSPNVIVNVGKCGKASLVASDNVDKMCAITRDDGPPPLAGRNGGNSNSKLFTKDFLYFRERNVLEALWQKKRISERTEIGLLARTLEVSEEASLVSVEIVSVQLGIEVNLPEIKSSFCLELIRMRLQERLQIGIGGLTPSRKIIGKKLQLLPKPPANDGVVPVQTHGNRSR